MIQIALLAAAMTFSQAKAPAKSATPEYPLPGVEEPQPDKTKLKLVTDGKEHYFAWGGTGIPDPVYWSADGKQFFKLKVFGGGAEGDKSFDVVMWEPRIRANTGFGFRDGKYSTNCGEKKIDFQLVPADKAKAVLDAATFYKPRWTRMPYALSRDEKGTYYFVDHVRDEEGRTKRDFRLFVGPRGSLKEQKMTNLVSDTEGDIFGTKSGDFRLVLPTESGAKQRESKWVSNGKETRLTIVPVQDNAQVIYNDLGVYERAKLGTPCDEF